MKGNSRVAFTFYFEIITVCNPFINSASADNESSIFFRIKLGFAN